MEILQKPWPWYVVGLIAGLTVPALLLLGNKHFGISANFRHACAACFHRNIPFFKYDWRKEAWNMFFVGGIFLGAVAVTQFFPNAAPIKVSPSLLSELKSYGIHDHSKALPREIFSVDGLFSLRGLIMLVGGGFLVGFGARYAGGCTSGHAIMGISNLQMPSIIATVSFMAGGFLTVNFILPHILSL